MYEVVVSYASRLKANHKLDQQEYEEPDHDLDDVRPRQVSLKGKPAQRSDDRIHANLVELSRVRQVAAVFFRDGSVLKVINVGDIIADQITKTRGILDCDCWLVFDTSNGKRVDSVQ